MGRSISVSIVSAAAYGGECKEQFQTAQEMRNELFIPGACNQYYYAALSAGRDSAYEDRDSDRAASGDRGSILRAFETGRPQR